MDAAERRTGQLDVVIYDRNVTAPLLAEASGDLLPAESLLAVIEVKSLLTKGEIEKCARAAKAISRLRPYKRPFVPARKGGLSADDGRHRCQFSVVAFSSDLGAKDWCTKEWERLKLVVDGAGVPIDRIDRVLVLDRGMLVPPSATARTAPEGKEMLREWFLHMSNFLIREAARRPPFDLQDYGRRQKNPGWQTLERKVRARSAPGPAKSGGRRAPASRSGRPKAIAGKRAGTMVSAKRPGSKSRTA